MTGNQKSKYIKSLLLVLSTLLFPLQIFSIVFWFVPALYISAIVPYYLWKIWFGENNQKIKIYSLFWKVPIIFFIAYTMLYMEMLLSLIIFAIGVSLIGKIIIFVFLIFLLRCLVYAMMIFIWQPMILKSYKIWVYVGIVIYCAANSYFIYLIRNAPDTDDYNISFSEYMSSK